MPYRSFASTFHTLGSRSSVLAVVRQKVMISAWSLQTKCSLKPWHQPIVPFPSPANPLNTLFMYRLTLWQTGIMVEST